MEKELFLELLRSSIVPKFAEACQASNTPVVGYGAVRIVLKRVTFQDEPGNDIYQFGYDLPGYRHQYQPLTFTRKELRERLFQHDLNMMMIKGRGSNCCELAEQFPCDKCCYEGDCPGIKLDMALSRYPGDLGLLKDKGIIESEEFMEGLDAVCRRIDEAVAARLLIKDQG